MTSAHSCVINTFNSLLLFCQSLVVFLKGLHLVENRPHVHPALQRLVEACCVLLIVHHDIRLKAHVSKRIDAFKVLLWSRIVAYDKQIASLAQGWGKCLLLSCRNVFHLHDCPKIGLHPIVLLAYYFNGYMFIVVHVSVFGIFTPCL